MHTECMDIPLNFRVFIGIHLDVLRMWLIYRQYSIS
jgi:hypothetical protein